MVLSKSEAGKIGGQKSKLVTEKRLQKRIEDYLLSPNLCIGCRSIISYQKRKNKFCSHSCAATKTNQNRSASNHKEQKICQICETTFTKDTIFCSQKCLNEDNRRKKWNEFQKGLLSDRPSIKRIMFENISSCQICGLSSWLNQPINLILDHIDGDAGNNNPENLRLICPNCDSYTPTWKGRNRGKGRKSRGLILN